MYTRRDKAKQKLKKPDRNEREIRSNTNIRGKTIY